MFTSRSLNFRNFTIATIITMVVASALIILSYTYGNKALFLLLNEDLGKAGDFFLNYMTHAGDGMLWLVWLVAIFRHKRRDLLPLILATFIFSTLLAQLGKQLVYPDELRPSEAFKIEVLGIQLHDEVKSINGTSVETNQDVFRQLNKLKKGDDVLVAYTRAGKPDTIRLSLTEERHLHLLDDITLHTFSSFPSGHTATAFAFALLISLLVRSAALTIVCVMAAILVGYTRIYLAQHFPLDVGAGMVVAVISVGIAIPVNRWFAGRSRPNKIAGKAL